MRKSLTKSSIKIFAIIALLLVYSISTGDKVEQSGLRLASQEIIKDELVQEEDLINVVGIIDNNRYVVLNEIYFKKDLSKKGYKEYIVYGDLEKINKFPSLIRKFDKIELVRRDNDER